MDLSSIGQSFIANQGIAPFQYAPRSGQSDPSSGDSVASPTANTEQLLQEELQVVEMLLKLLSRALDGGSSSPSDSIAPSSQQPPEQQLDSATPQGSQSNPTQASPPQQTASAPQQIASSPQQLTGQTTQTVSPAATSLASQPQTSATVPVTGSSGTAGNAPVGGVNTTSTTGQREDVLLGSYTDPQDLADPGAIAQNPRVGLWLTQLGFDQSVNSNQQQAIAGAWAGKGYSLERATYANGYGNAQSGGLNQQFTSVTGGKEQLNTQTADLGDESGVISDSSASQFLSDLSSQRAAGQNLLPVYGPNAPAGSAGSYTQGFNSPNFDNFRKVAQAAGGFVLDAPPSLLNNPQYTQWYQSATRWAHANGLKVEWYASPAQGDTDPSAYLSGVKQAVDTMNATGTNPDTYIMGNYQQNNPAATVATEEEAADYVLNNTTQTPEAD